MLVNAAPVSGYYGTEVARPVSTGEGVAARSRLLIPPVEQPRPSERGNGRDATGLGRTAALKTTAPGLAEQTPSTRESADNARQPETDRSESKALPGRQEAEAGKALSAGTEADQQADEQLIAQLRSRDREVRVHEAAHAATGGRYAGSPNLQFRRGPDGVNYAVGGEVSISTSPVSGDPQATLEKARVIRSAALAPAQPSMQDRMVAAKATRLEAEARVDLQKLAAAEQAERDAQAASARAKREAQSADEPESLTERDPAVKSLEDKKAKPVVDEKEEKVAESSKPAEEDTKVEESQDKPNAREELEKILLAGKTLSQQLNEMGLVDPENPYGKSGYIEMIV